MKKIVLDLAVSLDGFIEGPNGEIDWCIMDEDMDFNSFLDSIDTIFYGRVSYDAWGNFLPDGVAEDAERQFWKSIHSKRKYVFSTRRSEDSRAEFINADIASRVSHIKQQDGGDIWLYGGAKLIKTFIDLRLIDVYRISMHPVALGSGKPLFENLKERLSLELIDTKITRSGVVQLIYIPGPK